MWPLSLPQTSWLSLEGARQYFTSSIMTETVSTSLLRVMPRLQSGAVQGTCGHACSHSLEGNTAAVSTGSLLEVCTTLSGAAAWR